ncbi:UNVERIFIED_CONTAM: hypothetical protein Slati_2167400 [Sesamum latifolium]|uniref:Uncharacterized protein n=1 Tax=Sesamum latifolium TaxID=2727402 RepID=A0AAW2WRH1_9LAMI
MIGRQCEQAVRRVDMQAKRSVSGDDGHRGFESLQHVKRCGQTAGSMRRHARAGVNVRGRSAGSAYGCGRLSAG